MSNKGCIDIVYREWPEKLEAWLRVERKLNAIKDDAITCPARNVSYSEFDSEEREVLNKLLQYLVKEYERMHRPLEKYGPSVLLLGLRELIEKLS
jgi:hypothetical protein